MNALRTLIAVSAATLASACAGPGGMNASPPRAPAMTGMGTPMPMSSMEPRMKAMQDMHQKMMTAKTAPERQALMADHMASMQMMMDMMSERMPPATQ